VVKLEERKKRRENLEVRHHIEKKEEKKEKRHKKNASKKGAKGSRLTPLYTAGDERRGTKTSLSPEEKNKQKGGGEPYIAGGT